MTTSDDGSDKLWHEFSQYKEPPEGDEPVREFHEVQGRPWEPENTMGRSGPLQEMQPSRPAQQPRRNRNLYPNPGRWPYRDTHDHERVEDFQPDLSTTVLSNRVAIRLGYTGDQTNLTRTASLARQISEDMPTIVKMAHDSGDAEVIFHCPFCFTGSTRYLTESGVKTFAETAGTTQRVLTADRDQRTSGRWVDAHIHEFGEQPIMRVTVQRNQRTMIVEATPEHRWLVKSNLKKRDPAPRISRKGKPRDWRPTHCGRNHLLEGENVRLRKNGTRECKACAALAQPVGGVARSTDRDVLTNDLKPGDRLSHLRQEGAGDLLPDEAGIRHGIVFGDGTAHGRTASVSLWGEKDKQLLRYFPNRRLKAVNTANRVLGTGVPGVEVRGELWSWMKALPESDDPTYLYGWLAGYFAADGTVSKQGQATINSATLEHLEAVRDTALRLGIATYGITMKMRVGFEGREPSPLYGMEFVGSTLNDEFFLIEEHRNRFQFRDYEFERLGWTVASVEDTGRTEKVYCAVVPDTHSFALDGNIWVGNCGSGQVVARNDGTVECEFCSACFTVQVQPQYPAFPQTINGVPVDVPGMGPQWPGQDPAQPDAGQPVPSDTDQDADGVPDDQEGPPEDGADDGGDDGGNPFAKKSFRTASGAVLTGDQYLRHVALATTHNRDALIEVMRRENRNGNS